MKKLFVFFTIISFIFVYGYLGIITLNTPLWIIFYLIIALLLTNGIFRVQKIIETNYDNGVLSYDNLDVLKYVLSIIIIICHLRPFLEFSQELDFAFNNLLSRVAVPIFFIITGYFVGRKNDRSKIIIYIKRMIPLYLFYSILYIPIMVGFALDNYDVMLMYMEQFHLNFTLLFLFSPIIILIGLIYIGTFYHLWYFPALIEALLVIYWWTKKRNINSLLIISLVFLLFGCVETYYGILPVAVQNVVNVYFNIFITTRNFLFFGLFYVCLGYKIGQINRIYTKHIGIKLSFSIFLYFIEVYILYQTPRLNSNIFIMAMPVAYYLFMFCLNWTKHNFKFDFREYSKYYYLIHPLIIFSVGLFREFRNYPMLNVVVVLLLTHLVSFIIIKGKSLTR